MSSDRDAVYTDFIDEIYDDAPFVAKALDRADHQRRVRMRRLAGGIRLRGLSELFGKLEEIELAWRSDPSLCRIAFLTSRAIYDFTVALEAGIDGYVRTAADAMRSAMETELLLLDFYIDPTHVDDWLKADRKRLIGFYGPGAIRKRIAESGLNSVLDTENVDLDYQGHSQSVHVSPYTMLDHLIEESRYGDEPLKIDLWMSELFEHGRRLGNAFLLCAKELSPESAAAAATGGELPDFSLGCERTQEAIRPFLGKLREAVAGRSQSQEARQ